MFLFSLSAQSQVVSKDSINTLKQEKDVLVLQKEVNDQKLKLASLENSVREKQLAMENAKADAQKSADENQRIATELSNKPDDKKLARKARRTAKKIQRDASKMRSTAESLDGLQKDIDTLRQKIADNEQKIASLQPVPKA
jgi:chromosome segregation ATPase